MRIIFPVPVQCSSWQRNAQRLRLLCCSSTLCLVPCAASHLVLCWQFNWFFAPPSCAPPASAHFCGCHNRRQFYLCCFMSTLTRALMLRVHTLTRTLTSYTRSVHARSVDIFINVAHRAAKPDRVETSWGRANLLAHCQKWAKNRSRILKKYISRWFVSDRNTAES